MNSGKLPYARRLASPYPTPCDGVPACGDGQGLTPGVCREELKELSKQIQKLSKQVMKAMFSEKMQSLFGECKEMEVIRHIIISIILIAVVIIVSVINTNTISILIVVSITISSAPYLQY